MWQLAAFFKHPLSLFLLKILALYLAWELLYDTVLHPNGKLDLTIVDSSIFLSTKLLNLLGFRTFTGAQRLFGIDNTNGLWVGDPCNGLALFALFSVFIIAFPGNSLKKLIFIPIGIAAIYVINVLRMVALAIIQYKFPRPAVEFHHSYTFTFLVYGFILFLWMLWVKKFSGLSFKN